MNPATTGLLKGSGKLSGAVQNAGTVAPGNSPGLLTIDGLFTQTSTGLLQIEIGGTGASGSDMMRSS